MRCCGRVIRILARWRRRWGGGCMHRVNERILVDSRFFLIS